MASPLHAELMHLSCPHLLRPCHGWTGQVYPDVGTLFSEDITLKVSSTNVSLLLVWLFFWAVLPLQNLMTSFLPSVPGSPSCMIPTIYTLLLPGCFSSICWSHLQNSWRTWVYLLSTCLTSCFYYGYKPDLIFKFLALIIALGTQKMYTVKHAELNDWL
jgi:hypothetical protein